MLFLSSIFYGLWASGSVFFSCELGHRFSDAVDGVNDEFCKTKWYLFPIEIQRLLPTLMLCIQKPVAIKCFGNVRASREQYKMVNQIHNNLIIESIDA